eukprot:CAMPEP_0181329280 /NCGR_PEP_ID=MMETSP1101-20121128/23219_1 /TAXON_ID=46948 /ORGANISM="Rhodomonas abbreviata, Strain Caron Lab Isolate" /LENGTH=146 /DNA_ID=CAMNT_0023438333 /DNA_START=62 /DNA_END=502 /DNA_ORIENTATION=+
MARSQRRQARRHKSSVLLTLLPGQKHGDVTRRGIKGERQKQRDYKRNRDGFYSRMNFGGGRKGKTTRYGKGERLADRPGWRAAVQRWQTAGKGSTGRKARGWLKWKQGTVLPIQSLRGSKKVVSAADVGGKGAQAKNEDGSGSTCV